MQRPARHVAVERYGPLLLDELHGALHQRVLDQELVIGMSEDIDDGMTDRHDLMGS